MHCCVDYREHSLKSLVHRVFGISRGNGCEIHLAGVAAIDHGEVSVRMRHLCTVAVGKTGRSNVPSI